MRKISLLIAAGLVLSTAGCVQSMDSGYPNTAYGYGPSGNGYSGYSSPPASNGLGPLIATMLASRVHTARPMATMPSPTTMGRRKATTRRRTTMARAGGNRVIKLG